MTDPITPAQLRMARAALSMTMREAATWLDLSAMAISRFERGDESVISVATAKRIAEWFQTRRVYFGPKDGVCIDSDAFAQERWYAAGLFQLLKERDAVPSSTELIEAAKRAREPN